MKLRFLAAFGPAGARQQLASELAQYLHHSLVETHLAAPMSLWSETGTPLLRNEDATAVAIGVLFDRSANRRQTALPRCEALERTCVADFWGSYVLLTGNDSLHSVLRDPSGSIPVYHATAGDLHLYASDADMLRLAWPEPFFPDLDAVRHWLRFPFLRTARTGALDVAELLPGMARDVSTDRQRLRRAWCPMSLLASDCAITSFDDATSVLRDDILRSVRLLAEGQSNVVLQLSGGLDSSIVAAALAQGGIDYRAITFATRSADGDERRYARQVARDLGIELLELTEADVDLSGRTSSGPFQRPPSLVLQALRCTQLTAAGSDALLLDGGGGDNVFGSITSASPALDAFRHGGIADGVRAIRNIAARHGCTFWTAASSALRRARRRTIGWPSDDSFLGSSVPEAPEPHPWLESFRGSLPGSADHLRMIAGIHHFLIDPGPGDPCNLHPLISQPVVETCLRIRSWLWFEGGRDRAVARAAFRKILPDAILDRRSKGSLQSMFVNGFTALHAELRDYLVSGRLAEEGIIDARAVAEYFDRSHAPHEMSYVRILEIASAEQWLRSFG